QQPPAWPRRPAASTAEHTRATPASVRKACAAASAPAALFAELELRLTRPAHSRSPGEEGWQAAIDDPGCGPVLRGVRTYNRRNWPVRRVWRKKASAASTIDDFHHPMSTIDTKQQQCRERRLRKPPTKQDV
ncbi:hypothetical protein Dimus_006193, partial [Dionaea muscipula]